MFKRILFVLIMILLITSNAYSISCVDKITSVIAHSDGNIYFKTSTVCRYHWCVLGKEKWNTSDKIKSALSVLLSANATQKNVVLEWDSTIVPTCTTALDEFATPAFISIRN